MRELKPCPFCRSQFIGTEYEVGEGWQRVCPCGARGPRAATPEAAITAWNIRVLIPEMGFPIEAQIQGVIKAIEAGGPWESELESALTTLRWVQSQNHPGTKEGSDEVDDER